MTDKNVNAEIYRLELLAKSFDDYILNLKDFLYGSIVSKKDGEKLINEIFRATTEKNQLLEIYSEYLKISKNTVRHNQASSKEKLNEKFAEFYEEDDFREWISSKKKQILRDLERNSLLNKNLKNNL